MKERKDYVIVFKKDGQVDIPYWGLEYSKTNKHVGQETVEYLNSLLGANLIEIEHYSLELSKDYIE